MNYEDINKIKDSELQKIRMKYWNLRHKAFLDEYKISDQDIGEVWDELFEAEEKEVTAYLRTWNK